jgi:NAD(P) transhydrogenase subunit alpha
MEGLTAQQAADAARDAAARALDAADQAQAFADNARLALDAGAEGIGAATGIDPFVFRLSIFVLAIFVGYFVVWSVTSALHTPLMSVTNAISSVIVVGALIAVGGGAAGSFAEASATSQWLGFGALILASINIFGGFLVTQRMLAMYRRKS